MRILIFSIVSSAYCVLAMGQSHTVDGSSHKTPLQDETTAKGCLLGQNGKFILITSKPSSILQLAATPNLEAHAGHKVKITGTIEDAPAPSALTPSPAKDEPPASTLPGIPSSGQLRVRKIKTISACDSHSDKTSQKSWMRFLNL
jgi:hypothetical protein